MTPLIDALTAATQADLDQIDAEILRLKRLREVVALLVGKGGVAAAARAAVRERMQPCWSEEATPEARRLKLARVLLENGPLSRAAMFFRANIPDGSSSKLLPHPWFEKVTRHARSPWRLSAAGRAALSETADSPRPEVGGGA